MRGALALALALRCRLDLPQRDDILIVAFAVVAFSVIVQGLTAPFALRWLGLAPANGEREAVARGSRRSRPTARRSGRHRPMSTFAFSTFAAAQPRDLRHVGAEQRPQVVVEGRR